MAADAHQRESQVARPLVIELFTSQGCSSCPPAEELLGALVDRPSVLALAFHVDYWDSIGWKDRFGLPASVERQRQYVRKLGLSTPYTPQFVLDGSEDLSKAGTSEIQRQLNLTRTGVPINLQISQTEIHVAVADASATGDQDVELIAYQAKASTSVGRGENAGRQLREFNIVRAVVRLGERHGAAAEWHYPLNKIPAGADHVAVFVRRSGLGEYVGAVSLSLSSL